MKDEGLLRHEIDDALERFLFADGQLNRNDRAVAGFAQRVERARQAGALAIEPVEHDEPRQAELPGGVPHFLGLDHRSGHGVDHDGGGVDHVQRGARVAQEIADARRVDEVNLVLVPLGIREAGGQRVLACDLFFVKISNGRPFVDLAETVDHAGVGENGRGELGFSGAAVTDERDVSDAGGVVDLHKGSPQDLVIWSSSHLVNQAHHMRRKRHAARHEGNRCCVLFVSQRFDGVEAGGFDRRVHPEKDAHGRGEPEADREGPPGEGDGEAGGEMHGPAD